MQRKILVVASDLHGGHRHGLLNPDTVLTEFDERGNKLGNYHPELNAIQIYLWGIYMAQIKYVSEYAKGDDILFVQNGDSTAGNKYKQLLVSDRIADQIIIAKYNVEPWMKVPNLKAIRFITGTGAHVFGEGSSEILITEMMKDKYPKSDISVTDHSLIDYGGMATDISHHGPTPGSRKWLEGNEARYYLRDIMMRDLMSGKIPPRLIFRAHYHQYIEETLQIQTNGHFYKSTIIISPSFSFIDNHARQSVKSPNRITHGSVMVEVVDGEPLRIIPLVKTIDIRTKEIL